MSVPLAQHWNLDSQQTFLNHGSFGACPREILEKQGSLRNHLERNPVEFLAFQVEALLNESSHRLAGFLKAPASDIAFVPNATHGVNAVLKSLRFAPGDELLVTNHEYNACRQTLDHVAEIWGASIVVADIPFPIADAQEATHALLEKVSPKTKFCLVDHITSATALVLPVEKIVPALQAQGVEVMVDGAHAPGMLNLDLAKLGADYYTGNCHKWLCSPKGAGFLYVQPKHQEKIHPAVTSHGRNSTRKDISRFHEEFHWTGTSDPTAWLCVGDTLDWMSHLLPGGWGQIRRQNHELVCEARRTLCARWEMPPLCPESMLGSMACIQLPRMKVGGVPLADGPTLESPLTHALRAEGITVPVISWPSPVGNMVRISAQVYNSRSDYEHLADFVNGLRV
jgi:isopenicillin-N epimerase